MAKAKQSKKRRRSRVAQTQTKPRLSLVSFWWQKCMKEERKQALKEEMKKKNGTKGNASLENSVEVEDESQTVSSTSIIPVSPERSTISPTNGANGDESPRSINRIAFLPPLNGTDINSSSNATHQLFNSLRYSEDILSALPNRSWAIHSTDTPAKQIVVSSMIMHNSQESGLVPLYTKQIIFDEKLNFEILLVNSRMVLKNKPMSISSMHDFEDLMDYVDSMKICSGGPSVSQYNRVNLECAYRDSMNNWRHNLCSLEISQDEESCESCNSLEEILRRHVQRIGLVRSSGKRKR